MTTPYKSGKRFEEEINRSIEKLKERYGIALYHWKIKDAIAFGANTKYHTVPCDHMIVLGGTPYFIEDKSSINEDYYPCKYIKEHQLKALTNLHAAGGSAFFAFGKRNRENVTERAWLVSLRDYLFFSYDGKLEWNEMNRIGHKLKKIAGRKIFTYDLSEVIR